MGFYHSGRAYSDSELLVLTASLPVQRCSLTIFVLRDFSRVFVDGQQAGFDSGIREADAVEVEVEIDALAERFGWPELRQVLSHRREGERLRNN